MASPLNQVEVLALNFIAAELTANETAILADLAPLSGVAVDNILQAIEKALPAVIRGIVTGALEADKAAVTAALTNGEKQAFDFIVAQVKAEAAKLSA